MHLSNLCAAGAFLHILLAVGVGARGRGSPLEVQAGEPVQAALLIW